MRKVEEVGKPFKSSLLKGTKAGKWRTVISIGFGCILAIGQASVIYLGYQRSQKEDKQGFLTPINDLNSSGNHLSQRFKELQSRKAKLEQEGMSVHQPSKDKSS